MAARRKMPRPAGLGRWPVQAAAFALALVYALSALALTLFMDAPAWAEARVWSPKMASDERKIILNAARVPVERDLGQPIVFNVRNLRVSKDWAFVYGAPRRSDGKSLDLSKSIYADRAASDDFSDEAAVLLAREGAGWRVVTYSVGFSDVVWETWDEEFGAPAWLWP